jgi:hypothetical protein
MDARSPMFPCIEQIDVIDNSLQVIRTLAVIPALLDEVTHEQITTILSVVDDYAGQAQTAAKNVTALLQSL